MCNVRINVNSFSATNALVEMGYDKSDIIESIHDVNERLAWNIHSYCSLYSRKRRQWFKGEIINILSEPNTKETWLVVQYNGKYTKKIQRFNKNIKPLKCEGLIAIIAFYAHKLRTEPQNAVNRQLDRKPTKKASKKKKKKKKTKRYYSGLGIDSRSEPQKYWRTININVVKFVLYAVTHEYEDDYNLYIPKDVIELIIKFFYYNGYVEILSQETYEHFKPHPLGERIGNKLEIAQNALFQFYASRCPKCRKVYSDTSGEKVLQYRWSLRGSYSESTKLRNNANVYQCVHCWNYIIINVKDHYFYYTFRVRGDSIRYKCYVTPFGSFNEAYKITADKLNEAYPKAGQCYECNMDTLQLSSSRGYDGFLKGQTRYCTSCGLFHQEQRVYH